MFYLNTCLDLEKITATNHAVLALVDEISTALDMGKVAIGCFIDLKKAFEAVNHFILINKLKKIWYLW